MKPLTFAVILGSTRPERKGEAVAAWVMERAWGRDAVYELVDLRDHPLPHYDERYPASRGQYELASTQEWASTVAPYDGYVFVTPEYNHSPSSALKNALDTVYAEWNDKAAALVSYGSMGGVRAADHLRQVLGALQVADIRTQLSFTLATDWDSTGSFAPAERHLKTVERMFDQLEAWAGVFKGLREPVDA
jgi:NAD(P)H-dependent FMN reductase